MDGWMGRHGFCHHCIAIVVVVVLVLEHSIKASKCNVKFPKFNMKHQRPSMMRTTTMIVLAALTTKTTALTLYTTKWEGKKDGRTNRLSMINFP